MKKIIIFIVSTVLLVSPVYVFAHGDEGEGEEHHLDEMMEYIEPCELGSVIKCGDHGDEGHSQTLEQVVNDLLVGFNVDSVAKLDCDKIVDHDFGHLGEALMSYMHPNEEEHEAIDAMMGGEGSESLDSMHEFMGKRYLGCNEGSFGPMMMGGGMMNAGMMGSGGMGIMGGQSSGFGGMMSSSFGLMGGFGIFQLIIWLLAAAGLGWIVKLLIDNSKK